MKNIIIIQVLESLLKQYKIDSSLRFKSRALEKAINSIKKYESNIKSGDDAIKNINGVAKGIGRRIDEILKSGTLKELKTNINSKTEGNAVDILMEVTGIGPSKAKNLVDSGIKSIDQLKKAIQEGKISSTHHINIGLKYYEDLKNRIPRHEITLMKKILDKEIKLVNKNLIFDICGSYRRGLKSSGDIDVLISNPKYENNIEKEKFLEKVVKKLKEDDFIVDSLTSDGAKKYMGVCKLKTSKYGRRIDIRCVNYSAFYSALVYFTGSKNFNLLMRKKAIELGYSLSEYSLKEKKSGKIIIPKSEEELFNILDMDYVKPNERDL